MELLMVVVAIGILALVAISLIGGATSDVRNVKLRSDVESLNEAVQVYQSNGGSMRGIDGVGAAIAKLKTRADDSSATVLVGLRGSMLDPRFVAEMMDPAEEATSMPRALWDPVKTRFVYATEGGGGAKRFVLDGAASGQDALAEARATALSYGRMTDWVWDYADFDRSSNTGVIDLATSEQATSGYEPITPPAATRLSPPRFSLEGGLYDYFDFSLAVEFDDPNPPAAAVIYYTLDDSRWEIYAGGSVLVGANQVLKAYSVSIDPDRFADSEFLEKKYSSTFTISGGAGGKFSDPDGDAGMVTNLLDGESSQYFSFGTAVDLTLDPSWLLFNGASFMNVTPGESFLLGSLKYYNGTIRSGTQATNVGLSIDLNFDSGGQTLSFGYGLELISTPNLSGNTAEESADYVRLGNLRANVPVELAGVGYNLVLEFGETTEGGFSSIDQFHVLEGASANGSLYGRLIEVPAP